MQLLPGSTPSSRKTNFSLVVTAAVGPPVDPPRTPAIGPAVIRPAIDPPICSSIAPPVSPAVDASPPSIHILAPVRLHPLQIALRFNGRRCRLGSQRRMRGWHLRYGSCFSRRCGCDDGGCSCQTAQEAEQECTTIHGRALSW